MPTNRPIVGRPWVKGQSGNPGGMNAAGVKFREMLKDRGLGDYCAELLERVVKGEEPDMDDAKSRMWAATEIMNRIYGKAPQHVIVDESGAEPTIEGKLLEALQLSPHDRRKRIADLEKKDTTS